MLPLRISPIQRTKRDHMVSGARLATLLLNTPEKHATSV